MICTNYKFIVFAGKNSVKVNKCKNNNILTTLEIVKQNVMLNKLLENNRLLLFTLLQSMNYRHFQTLFQIIGPFYFGARIFIFVLGCIMYYLIAIFIHVIEVRKIKNKNRLPKNELSYITNYTFDITLKLNIF